MIVSDLLNVSSGPHVRSKLTTGMIMGILVLAMFLLEAGPFQPRYCQYVIGHRVTAGETLWSIAQKYHDLQDKEIREFIFDIRKYNGGISPIIQPGQLVEIPIQKKLKMHLQLINKGDEQ